MGKANQTEYTYLRLPPKDATLVGQFMHYIRETEIILLEAEKNNHYMSHREALRAQANWSKAQDTIGLLNKVLTKGKEDSYD